MLDWIRGVFNDIFRTLGAWGQSLLNAISNVWSFANNIYHTLANAINSIRNWAWNEVQALDRFIVSVYNYARWIVDVALRDIRAFTNWVYNTALSYAKSVLSWAQYWVNWLKNAILSAIDRITQWVIRNVYDPLVRDFAQAWNWITHEGAYVWDLLTHPDKLAKLIAKWVFAEGLTVVKAFARPLGRWLIHSMLGRAGDVMDVLEAIISAII